MHFLNSQNQQKNTVRQLCFGFHNSTDSVGSYDNQFNWNKYEFIFYVHFFIQSQKTFSWHLSLEKKEEQNKTIKITDVIRSENVNQEMCQCGPLNGHLNVCCIGKVNSPHVVDFYALDWMT